MPVALGTDCNPGSSHTESMPMILLLAVLHLKLTIEEALTAATLNAACALDLGREIGSIEVGKLADVVLVDGDPVARISDVRKTTFVVKDGAVYRPAEVYWALGVGP